jgi:hypothetical protein
MSTLLQKPRRKMPKRGVEACYRSDVLEADCERRDAVHGAPNDSNPQILDDVLQHEQALRLVRAARAARRIACASSATVGGPVDGSPSVSGSWNSAHGAPRAQRGIQPTSPPCHGKMSAGAGKHALSFRSAYPSRAPCQSRTGSRISLSALEMDARS